MELTLQTNKSGIFIKNYENHKFYIDNKVFENSIIIKNESIAKWEITDIKTSTLNNYEEILAVKPEIIIIGTGEKIIIPDSQLIQKIHEKNIGIEFMKTESACKTYNLLISENRKVCAGLIL